MPLPVALAFAALSVLLTATAIVGNMPGSPPPGAGANELRERGEAQRRGAGPATNAARAVRAPAPAAPRAAARWSGYAFDACRAPSQAVMDRWRTASPFSGVGIYLGGIHRACEQEHLTPGWVARQLDSGWKLLPIWVGPQASCTGYDHRIDPSPGRFDRYGLARARGVLEARRAVRAARALGLPRGEVLFYDIEGYDTGLPKCKWSSLAFLEEWTQELHRRGYRSGVYSHVNAAISLLSRTSSRYVRPDAVWYAWIDRMGDVPTEYVADAAFMHDSRVHQYALDTRVEFGGVEMDIDWNFVSLGATQPATPPIGCDHRAANVEPHTVRPDDRGPHVRVVQCLVLPGDRHPVKTSGRLDEVTVRAVRRFQERQGLRATGTVDRATWTSLLARGHEPVLKKGASGEHVARLQRSLRVALGGDRIAVDGEFGPTTARVVRRYRARLGLEPKDVVTPRVWKALERGRITPVDTRWRSSDK